MKRLTLLICFVLRACIYAEVLLKWQNLSMYPKKCFSSPVKRAEVIDDIILVICKFRFSQIRWNLNLVCCLLCKPKVIGWAFGYVFNRKYISIRKNVSGFLKGLCVSFIKLNQFQFMLGSRKAGLSLAPSSRSLSHRLSSSSSSSSSSQLSVCFLLWSDISVMKRSLSHGSLRNSNTDI